MTKKASEKAKPNLARLQRASGLPVAGVYTIMSNREQRSAFVLKRSDSIQIRAKDEHDSEQKQKKIPEKRDLQLQ